MYVMKQWNFSFSLLICIHIRESSKLLKSLIVETQELLNQNVLKTPRVSHSEV